MAAECPPPDIRPEGMESPSPPHRDVDFIHFGIDAVVTDLEDQLIVHRDFSSAGNLDHSVRTFEWKSICSPVQSTNN